MIRPGDWVILTTLPPWLRLVAVMLAAPLAGCGPSVIRSACDGGGTGPLVSGAAIFRVEVYGAAAHCAGNTLAAGAGVPVAEHSFAPGEPITLEAPNGPHAVILTAYADTGGTRIVGVGCLDVTLPAGSQLCFDLTLTPPASTSDGGSGSDGGIVATCGNQDQPCCAGPTPCNANLGCVGGMCVCGGMNQPCCAGSACQLVYCCTNGTCQF